MSINRTLSTPVHLQVENWLRSQLAGGHWPEHFRLPSEPDLARQLGVNRGTLRRAIAALTDAGLLTTIHGRGTFVAPGRLEQPLADSLVTFSEDLLDQGIPFETRVIGQRVQPAEAKVEGLLGVPPGAAVFHLERIRIVRGEPFGVLRNYVPYALCPQIEQIDFNHQRLFQVLEDRYQIALAWGRRFFEAQPAGELVSRLLGLAPETPALYMQQIVYQSNNTPIELSDVWLRGDRVRLATFVERGQRNQLAEIRQPDDSGA